MSNQKQRPGDQAKTYPRTATRQDFRMSWLLACCLALRVWNEEPEKAFDIPTVV